jgi:hypothetical protein
MSLEMDHKVIVPQKKNMSCSFLNSGTLIVIIKLFDITTNIGQQSIQTLIQDFSLCEIVAVALSF